MFSFFFGHCLKYFSNTWSAEVGIWNSLFVKSTKFKYFSKGGQVLNVKFKYKKGK